jgi:hypothetical protein
MKREWQTYFIRPEFAESPDQPWPKMSPEEVDSIRAAKFDEWESHILRLSNPIIAFSTDITTVVNTSILDSDIRIYPPFPIDRKGETSGAFKDWWLPEGENKVEKFVRFPSYAVPGVVTEMMPVPGAKYCQGIRMDLRGTAHIHRIVQILLEQVCQHTHQWWLRGRSNPFSGLRRHGCKLNRDFSFAELRRYRGAGTLNSPWHAVIETQNLLGFELVLTEQIWLRCVNQASMGMRGDMGLLAFHDAISYYMDSDEVLCIISMTICVEVLGNKRRLLLGKKPTGFAELIKSSDLIDDSIRKTIHNLFVDRGHVAHGRRPPRSEGRADQLFTYLDAVRKIVSTYTSKLSASDWQKVSQLEVARA